MKKGEKERKGEDEVELTSRSHWSATRAQVRE
jgi:hypothetical protein